MDNDIIERAKEYADRHKETEINYFGIGKVYGYSRIYNAEITAYERGAKEQKAIDEVNYKQGYHDAIEKAKKESILRCRMCKHWGTIDYWGNPTNYTVGNNHSCKFFKTKDGKCYKRHRALRPACEHFERKEE